MLTCDIQSYICEVLSDLNDLSDNLQSFTIISKQLITINGNIHIDHCDSDIDSLDILSKLMYLTLHPLKVAGALIFFFM